jgi:RNA polymerase sigma-70 factor (ECF subfamily)
MTGFTFSTVTSLLSRSDEEAMWRVKTDDDHSAFARLVGRWEEPIRRLCTRMTCDAHRGEDLKQETFLRVFAKRKDYEPRSRFSTYVWRIALNLCYDELRRQERRREFVKENPTDDESDLPECPADAPGPDDCTIRLEEGELVRRALLQLPALYRTVLVLRHYEGLKLSRIAEVLEIPEGTVNSRMAEALSRLGRLLAPKLKDTAQKVTPGPEPKQPERNSVARTQLAEASEALIVPTERFVV